MDISHKVQDTTIHRPKEPKLQGGYQGRLVESFSGGEIKSTFVRGRWMKELSGSRPGEWRVQRGIGCRESRGERKEIRSKGISIGHAKNGSPWGIYGVTLPKTPKNRGYGS